MKQYDGKTIKRLMRYIYEHSKGLFILAAVCVLLSTAANTGGSMFIQILIDKYIEPLLMTEHPVFSGLIKMLTLMGCIYLLGALCTLLYSQFMVNISQGCLKTIRDDMFNHMQTLPIRYFDTHTHGDIMSHYTNDTDTLRQFISQALPQLFSSVVSVVFSFCIMLYYSIPLSIVVVVITILILLITKYVATHSTRYFGRQQTSLGNINGYIEEMLEGQKVVKVFCHETKAEEGFDKKNERLYEDARNANRYANILMPILSQIGNFQYILLAILGGCLVLSGKGNITAGVVVAFLSLSKAFSIAMIIYLTGIFGRIGVMAYYFIYVLQAPMGIAAFGTAMTAGMLVVNFYTPQLLNKMNKKYVGVLACILQAGCCVAFYFMGEAKVSSIAIAVVGFIYGATNMVSLVSVSLCGELIDDNWLRTGKRSDGVIVTAVSFSTKIANAIGGSVGIVILGAVGFVANTEMSAATLTKMNAVINFGPVVCFLAAIIPFLMIRMTNAKGKENEQKLKEMMSKNEGAM